jgi:DNA-binding LacI/PurR family transcriptional regulator
MFWSTACKRLQSGPCIIPRLSSALTVARLPRRPPGTRSVLADIAREAGVSTATVSRVINNRGTVTSQTREIVLRAIERHNYYPNAQARSLALGRTNLVGLIISDISNPFFPDLVKEMESAAFEHDFDLILANTNYDPQRVTSYVRRFIERGVGGVAIMTSEFDRALLAELARREVSVVLLDPGRPGPHISHLVVDYQAGIDEAVAHLAALGHRRIAFVGGPHTMRSSQQRLCAFVSSVERRLGEAPGRMIESDYRFEGGRLAAAELLQDPTRHTAVVAANDMMALGILHECRARGVTVPCDLSVIGFDDIVRAALSYPPLTTISLSRQSLGRRAIEALLATLNHPDRVGVALSVPTSLVVRESTGPVR